MKTIYHAWEAHCEFRGRFPDGLAAADIEDLYNSLYDWDPIQLGSFSTLEEATEALPDENSLSSNRVKSFPGFWFCDSTVAYVTEDECDEDGEFFQELSTPVFRAAPLAPLPKDDEEEE